MLPIHILLVVSSLLLPQGLAQRGGGGWEGSGSGRDGDWGDDVDYDDAGRPIQAIITQTQVQTKTMVTTAISKAATTIVQATTIVKVSTVAAVVPSSPTPNRATSTVPPAVSVLQQAPLSSPTPSPPASQSPNLPASPAPSNAASGTESVIASPTDQGQSPDAVPSDAGLTVGPVDPSATTKAIGAAQEVSAPSTVLTATVPSFESGSGMRTTGVPNFDNGANGVVYGHVRLGSCGV
jgi:hypothetical protein